MNAQTIINAAKETSLYYKLVDKDEKMAIAFLRFSRAIEEELYKEETKERESHSYSLKNAYGSYGQG